MEGSESEVRSGSVLIIPVTDPDPGGPKTYGSGSRTLPSQGEKLKRENET